MKPIFYPSADEIAVAVVAASKLHGDDPIDMICNRWLRARARYVAMAALLEEFPDAPSGSIAKCIGFASFSSAKSNVERYARKTSWWRDGDVTAVRDAMRMARFKRAHELPKFLPTNTSGFQKAAHQVKQLPETIATQTEIITSNVSPRLHSPLVRDEGALPAPRVARRRVVTTAAILGDPPVGRSALAQRDGGAA